MVDGKLETLAVIVKLEEKNKLKSLFQVFAHSSLTYPRAWNYLQDLERDGLVVVKRNGPGSPLKIVSTEAGRKLVAECPWQLDSMEMF